jgi:DNA (cytosine-5)-methyltransferase 1
MENVVGLLTHNGGLTLERILDSFDSLDYNVDWRVLNAASYGVPQKRERFIMIAARDHAPVSFPVPSHHFSGKVIGYKDKSRFPMADTKSPKALTVADAIDDLPSLTRGAQASTYDRLPHNSYQRARRLGSTGLTLHKAANHSDKMMQVIRRAGGSINCIPNHLVSSGFSSCYSRLSAGEPSTTITVKFQSPASSKCIHPTQNRTITPREAARIQSFDDSYKFRGSLTHVAAQLGNAVPPLLSRAIAASVLKMLD